MLLGENLAALDLPWVGPRQPRRSLSLPNHQTGTGRQCTAIALADELSRSKSKLWSGRGVGCCGQSLIEEVAFDRYPQA